MYKKIVKLFSVQQIDVECSSSLSISHCSECVKFEFNDKSLTLLCTNIK